LIQQDLFTSRGVRLDGKVVVGFAGAGGSCRAIAEATGRSPDVAMNHDAVALDCHKRNHPTTRHLLGDIWDADPKAVVGRNDVALAWFSPDCRHHSRLRGGRVVSARVRALPWVAVRWARTVRPAIVATECVAQMTSWGPLLPNGKPDHRRHGQTYAAWVRAFQRLGYNVDWRVLTASDFGAKTSRRRLFVVACLDGAPAWPSPVSGVDTSALSCIDWSLPWSDETIPEAAAFRRPRALERGVEVSGVGNVGMVTVGYGERDGQPPRALDLRAPLGTVVAGGIKHALVTEDGRWRRLTPREGANAMGFPASYWLPETSSVAQRLVGNSVPIPAVAALLRANLGAVSGQVAA
jgi:DNA (cytosine-5)-methyltransferase 1